MEIARGILVDAKGNFLGAFQWDASRPRPQFNLPRQGQSGVRPEDLKTLLAESVAEPGMEFKRWDFKNEVWIAPNKKGWLIDERGSLRGSRTYFSDQIPNVPVGWRLIEQAPPKKVGQKAYFDVVAGGWKFPQQVARIENDTFVNFVCVRDVFSAPPGVEYINRPLTLLAEPVVIGATRDANGDWSNPLE